MVYIIRWLNEEKGAINIPFAYKLAIFLFDCSKSLNWQTTCFLLSISLNYVWQRCQGKLVRVFPFIARISKNPCYSIPIIIYLPKTSADLCLTVNQASSPNCPLISLCIPLCLENPQTADTNCGWGLLWILGSDAGKVLLRPLKKARDIRRPVNHKECII